MKQPAVASVKQWVKSALALWRPITGTDRWTITVEWSDPNNVIDGQAAGAQAEAEYQRANIIFNVRQIAESGYRRDQVSYIVLHELCHCLNNPVVKYVEERAGEVAIRDAVELATTWAARAIWVAKYGKEPPE